MNYSALFIPFISLVITQAIVMDLAKFRFPTKKVLVILSIELAVQVAVNGPLLIIAGLSWYAKWYFLIMNLPVIITFLYISGRRDMRDLFTVLITIFISVSISIQSMWISQLHNRNYWWYNIVRIIIFAVVFFILHNFVRSRYLRIQEEVEKGWGVFCILPLLGAATVYFEYIRFSRNGNFKEVMVVSSAMSIFLTAVFAVFFYVFSQLHEKYMAQGQQRILSLQNKAQLDQFVQQKEASEKANRRWHDLRHNTGQLIELLEAGDTATAIAYLKEQQGMDEVRKEEYCLHPAVNSILCLWAERSRLAGISTEIHADVPDRLEIEPMELSALFANAFENAYDGCLRLSDGIQKFIKVEAHYNGKRLAIGFANTCRDDICFANNLPVSLKEGGGIGTRSITYTVKRFHGAAFFEAKDGVFSARFVLNV